jgi:hypothetical protein
VNSYLFLIFIFFLRFFLLLFLLKNFLWLQVFLALPSPNLYQKSVRCLYLLTASRNCQITVIKMDAYCGIINLCNETWPIIHVCF